VAVDRIARRPTNCWPLRTLVYCALKWLTLAILSLALLRFIGLFTASTINQALVEFRGYAFVMAGKSEENGEAATPSVGAGVEMMIESGCLGRLLRFPAFNARDIASGT
jgi:hypothetical protein